MTDIIQAINDLAIAVSRKTSIDYLAVLLPIFLSVVALSISITTAKKQNKIALFEKRYDIYKTFLDIISYCDDVKDIGNNLPEGVKIQEQISGMTWVNLYFSIWFSKFIGGAENKDKFENFVIAKSELGKQLLKLKSYKFVFDSEFNNTMTIYIDEYHKFLDKILNIYIMGEDDISDNIRNDFKMKITHFPKDDIISSMEKELNLNLWS